MLDRLGATRLRCCKTQTLRLRTRVSKTDPWTKTSEVTGGGNLKLLFPSITVYFADHPDIDATNPGSFEALGSGRSGEVVGSI